MRAARVFLRASAFKVRTCSVVQARRVDTFLEPIREVWIHDEAFAASRLSMMRIMARRMNATTVMA